MSEAYKKLIKTLRTLFEMDKADLDFGIYRILNQKRDEISRFLDEDLLPQVKAAFADYAGGGKADLQAQLEQAIEQARHFGAPDPEQAPPVLTIKAKLASAVDITAVENEVYSHLHTFFSRYYDQGDFISQRRYKSDTYAIPYEGEEIKLYWANHDQYYVKSSEHLRDYAFMVHGDDGRTVRIKLVEADTEKDNVKAATDQERRFVLDSEQPLHLEGDELQIRFQYVPAGKKKKQDALNAEAVATIFAQKGYDDWLNLLRKPAPTEANPKRTLLEKHLNDYTARNTFDYFIHKDLGGFLRRELDFYIKSEVLHLDDVDDAAFAVTESHLRKIRVLRLIAQKIIRMLALVENFQKTIWLKKKFVVETQYCMTLDRIPETMYPEIAANQAQYNEWTKLFSISDSHHDGETTGRLESCMTVDFLKANRNLVLDTKHFDEHFRSRLLAYIDDFDRQCDGLLVHSENFGAINLISNRYAGLVSAINTDPPYNTGNDGFSYKDAYQHSSWLSSIYQTFLSGWPLLANRGVLFCAIGNHEVANLSKLLDSLFGPARNYGNFCWKARVKPVNIGSAKFRPQKENEFILAYEKLPNGNLGFSIFSGSERSYPYVLEGRKYRLATILKSNRGANRRDTMCFEAEGYTPPDGQRWQGGPDFIQGLFDEGKIEIRDGTPFRRYFEDEEGAEHDPFYCFIDGELSGTSEGGKSRLNHLVGNQHGFDTVKPIEINQYLVKGSSPNDALVLDPWAGSGTTGDAIVSLNRANGDERKYILIEMGTCFDAVLRPRINKVVYCDSWRDGKPVSDNTGISQCIKYIRLESYEDTLNNLLIRGRTKGQQDMLEDTPGLREDYMLGYWLDVETADSPSLLNIDQFEDPFNYKLNIATGSVGAFKPTVVDLVETFNYLIGLRVKHIDTIRGFKVVTGRNPQDESVLVIWRKVKEQDNAALEAFMDKQGYNPRDTEFDRIYVNGDHTLEDPHSKVKMTEIEFKRLMFDVQDV